MNLIPLADLIEQDDHGIKGDTVFVDMLPAEAERAILLRNPLTGTPINHELPGFFQTEFQLIVRVPAGQYDAGAELINGVINSLWMRQERQVEDMLFKYCRPRTEPVVFPLSVGNLLEFSLMFDCCFVKG